MEILDNINRLLGHDLKQSIRPGSKLRIAASCFSIYAMCGEPLIGTLRNAGAAAGLSHGLWDKFRSSFGSPVSGGGTACTR